MHFLLGWKLLFEMIQEFHKLPACDGEADKYR